MPNAAASLTVVGPTTEFSHCVLTPPALDFVAALQREFGQRRDQLLSRRRSRLARIEQGDTLDFLPDTADIRRQPWKVAPAPADLDDRRVEITGPVDRKMMINALNSGANVFMADLEDSCSPTWENLIEGQRNLRDAVRGTLSLDAAGKSYHLNYQHATLVGRPRRWPR